MNILIMIIATFNVLYALDDFSDDCEELFEENIHPKKCCNYPMRKILDEHSEKCKEVCKDSKSEPAGCCQLDCIYATTGVLKNGNLIEENVVQLYENFLQEKGGGKYDKWMNIIEESADACKNAVPKSSEVLVCNIPEFVMDFLDCVDSQNFLKCPDFKYSKACNKTRAIAENDSKCGIKMSGIFIVNHRFWDRKGDDDGNKMN